MIKMSCPYCEALHDVKEISRTETIELNGKKVKYNAIHYECCNCHEIFDSAEMMDKNIEDSDYSSFSHPDPYKSNPADTFYVGEDGDILDDL